MIFEAHASVIIRGQRKEETCGTTITILAKARGNVDSRKVRNENYKRGRKKYK